MSLGRVDGVVPSSKTEITTRLACSFSKVHEVGWGVSMMFEIPISSGMV